MIPQIWEEPEVQCELPGGMGRLHPCVQKRMTRIGKAKFTGRFRLHPERLMIPGVPGQGDKSPGSLVDAFPVDGISVNIEASKVAEHFLGFVFSAVQRVDNQSGLALVSKAVIDGAIQGRVWPYFEKMGVALFNQLIDGWAKLDRLPYIAPPVGCGPFLPRMTLAGDSGEQGNGIGIGSNPGECCQQFLPNGIHLVRVKRKFYGQPTDKTTGLFEWFNHLLEEFQITGQGNQVRAVDTSQFDPRVLSAKRLPRFFNRDAHRCHAASTDEK